MKNIKALILAGVIGLLIVAAGLGFLFGFDNPVSWVLIGSLLLIVVFYNWKVRSEQLVWKDSYSVGVVQLDNDHKQLIELVNKFQTAYAYHTGEEFERKALQELVDYTKYHFEHEEQLLQENGYPDFDVHKAQHVAMIAEVDRFLDDYKVRGHEALEGVARYLQGWLINHINGTDKQYSSFLNGKGVA